VGESGLFELIDAVFVYEFMKGEAMGMFPEVDLQII